MSDEPPVGSLPRARSPDRQALGESNQAMDAFEEIVNEARRIGEEASKFRHCSNKGCFERVVEVKCKVGHLSNRW